jgi:hypothetical protein
MLATSLLSREYIELQLRFATWISHGDAASFPQAVLVATNLFRRFRLGHPAAASTSSEWQGYVAELCGCTSLDAQVEWTSTFFAERRQLDAPPPDPAPDELVSGPFSAEVVGDALRFHFVPEIDTERSPLNASQLARRREELGMLVRKVVAQHPEVERVRGGSWLYSTGGYRSLFPPVHVASARVRDGIVRFQGSSSWGQFLDYRGGVKVDLGRRFVDGLGAASPTTPWRAFPMPSLWVESPVAVFIDYYGAQRVHE